MVHWEPFHAALQSGDRRTELLASIHRVESWLDPSLASRDDARTAADDLTSARAAYRALLLVRWRLMHELGLDLGPAGMAALETRLTECAGRAPTAPDADACRRARRARAAADCTAALVAAQPSVVVATPTPEAQAAHDALLALGERAQPAVEACGLGLATPDRLATLEALLGEFDALAAHFPPNDEFRPNLDHSRGHVALALAGGAAFLGEHDAALAWYARAADAFADAGDQARATSCHAQADALRARVAANLDADVAQALGAVVDAAPDPLDRAANLAALARQHCAAGDYFEAARTGDEATRVLTADAHVENPETAGIEAAAASLFAAAGARGGGTAFLERCTQAVATWSGIAQAGLSSPQRDAAGRARAGEMLAQVFAFATALTAEAAQDAAALDAALAPYGLAHAALGPAAAQAQAWQAAVVAFDAQVQQGLEACEALAPGAPCDDLAATAAALEVAAAAMPAAQRARCRLLTAGVRLQQGDAAGCRAGLDEAIAFVLQGRAPVPESFASAFDRQIYLDTQWTRFKAAGVADPPAALAVCVETVAFVEALRAHVGDPFQQSAFLASTTWAYDYGVGIARRLAAWDTMLGLMDLAKARSVLRRGPPPDAATLATWRAIDAEPDPTRRLRRWSLESIARAQSGPAPAPPTVAAVQAALDVDEVVLAYYWVAPTLLVAVVIDRAGLDVERIPFTDDDLEQLTDYTALLAVEQTNDSFDVFFDALGARIIPDACRARMRGKRRLVVSPHRALHLVPFHAADWEGAPLIEAFAVRYVPNLGSLLLPWTGSRDGPILAVGCGTFAMPNPPNALDDAEPEARAVGDAYAACGRAVTVRTGPDASRAALGALAPALPGFSIVHLATHARSVLAADATNDPLATQLYVYDAMLDGISVAALGLRADLVVLAACNSGQRAIAGRGLAELPGDDVFGFPAVLFESGVRGVLGALWPVKSEAARTIMTALHAGVARGEPADVALQGALRAHRAGDENTRHPIFWAPYYLVQVGRPTPTENTHDA